MPSTLVVLIGPTGVGKTELSLSIAERFNTCIVSADSRQLYADLKIGTAAPTPDQLARVPHHFVGTLKLTYPNLLNLTFARLEAGEDIESVQEFEPALDPLEHFIAFYAHQNKKQPSDAQIELVRGIIQEGGEA
jgi:hypothetical protein